MSTPIPDPGAVPDGPNFEDLPPSDDDPALPGPVPPHPDDVPGVPDAQDPTPTP